MGHDVKLGKLAQLQEVPASLPRSRSIGEPQMGAEGRLRHEAHHVPVGDEERRGGGLQEVPRGLRWPGLLHNRRPQGTHSRSTDFQDGLEIAEEATDDLNKQPDAPLTDDEKVGSHEGER